MNPMAIIMIAKTRHTPGKDDMRQHAFDSDQCCFNGFAAQLTKIVTPGLL